MKSKQNRTLKEFDSLYKMIDDVYHEIALSILSVRTWRWMFSERYLQTLLYLKTNDKFFCEVSGK